MLTGTEMLQSILAQILGNVADVLRAGGDAEPNAEELLALLSNATSGNIVAASAANSPKILSQLLSNQLQINTMLRLSGIWPAFVGYPTTIGTCIEYSAPAAQFDSNATSSAELVDVIRYTIEDGLCSDLRTNVG